MKIKSITRENFTGTVYNFHCKPDEMYFSHGMLVHNCYKSNNPNGHNMSFEQFKNIIDKMPFLTQCALGADAQGVTNPDMYDMMAYARSKGIVPNLTIADTSEEVAEKLAKVAGAVAVSAYKHAGFSVCFDSIDRLTKASMKNTKLIVRKKK